ncbi:hypothetical protein BVRB_041070 [Beta vulgaris subsp. vulgaris]|uniref:ABC transporter family G domain-containing protein n=1 Tax=Beta vulgaris subsp. vulgaris TaxID=3555 RepID=A0A0J8BGP7_BETVV|nr:hypothetical protein BVRB_041070 [Beta vulgaris subsp. vulgaris]
MFAEIQADPSRCLLLTTHQLDEAEAVCDRISIMVNGEIVCLGSAGHLSRKFGNHYQIDLNATAREHVGVIRNWFTNKYPRAVPG